MSPSLLALAIRIISICVMLLKVAKASIIVTFVCHSRRHFHLKMSPMETQLKQITHGFLTDFEPMMAKIAQNKFYLIDAWILLSNHHNFCLLKFFIIVFRYGPFTLVATCPSDHTCKSQRYRDIYKCILKVLHSKLFSLEGLTVANVVNSIRL